MRLDIKHWQLLEAVARYGSLGSAADAIGVTQSALSHRLAEAERRLGDAIFEREGRRLKATPAGQILLDTAKTLLPELARAEQDFERTAASASYLVRIGIATYSAYHWVPSFLKSLPLTREKLQLDFVAAATHNSEHALLSGVTDLLISPFNIENPAIISAPLMEDELMLMTHPEHPAADKTWIEAEDLTDQNYLTYSLDAMPGFEYDRFIRPYGIRLRHAQAVEMTDAISEMIAANLGVSILSRWALTKPITQGQICATSVTEQRLPLTWYVLMRQSDIKSPAIGLTKGFLLQWFEKGRVD